MKQIWINLELYFESYEFSNFLGIFMDFSGFILDFKSIKTIKINKKGLFFVRDPRGCDVARKATWQNQVDPRERLRGAEVTRVCIFTRNIGL